VALISYEGVGATLVRRLKFDNHRDALGPLAASLAELVGSVAGGSHGFDGVTWVPTTRARRRARGFDQAELIARAVADDIGVRCRSVLRREGSDHQVGHGRMDRLHGPTIGWRSQSPGCWLLVDDVVTTGASMRAAAAALRGAGASSVFGAALARTP